VAEKKHGTYEDIEERRERQEQSRIQRRIEKRSLETKKVGPEQIERLGVWYAIADLQLASMAATML